jgi:hypothetical protein
MRGTPGSIAGSYSSANPLNTGAWMEAGTATVRPQSLFRAQLAERLHGDYRMAAPNRPILLNPMPDAGVPGTFIISGIYDRYADAVTIYIDGEPVGDAVLGGAENNWEFTYTATLSPGYHTIQATLTEGEYTSALTAVRVVNVRNPDGSHNPAPSPMVYSVYTASISNLDVTIPRPVPAPVSVDIGTGAEGSDGAPAFTPAPEQPEGGNTLLIVLIAAGAVGATVAIVIAVVKRKK